MLGTRLRIVKAELSDIPIIQGIANITWPHTFGNLMSTEKLNFMMDMMYSTASMNNQILHLQHKYFIGYNQDKAIAYLSLEPNYNKQACTKIHKIYILPDHQSKGYGNELLEFTKHYAIEHLNTTLILNVKRDNEAVGFYRKVGFEIVGEINIDIGSGYFMEDYIMEKTL